MIPSHSHDGECLALAKIQLVEPRHKHLQGVLVFKCVCGGKWVGHIYKLCTVAQL